MLKETRAALVTAAQAVCLYCRKSKQAQAPTLDRGADTHCHAVLAENGPPGWDWCRASGIWKMLKIEKATK